MYPEQADAFLRELDFQEPHLWHLSKFVAAGTANLDWL
jgi:hypothetical protein